ncbi:MAG: sugar nucleotide-binding protein [Candidatus Andersenbacteria bacterium]|nr:sugar nucleotide-binding protein [Candidatus Andersenbacteria bacterium]
MRWSTLVLLKPDKNDIFLRADITNPPAAALQAVAQATHIVCATHLGSIDECAADPAATSRVNVEAVRSILRQADSRAVPVYISSNMVFSGEQAGYREDDVPAPSTEYGRQKMEMESWIQKNFPRHVIVRLTKVYGLGRNDGTLFTGWYQALKAGEPIKAVEDMVVAPVFVGDVARTMAALIQANEHGIFHMPGPVSASLFSLAVAAAKAWKLPAHLVEKSRRAEFNWKEKRPYWHTLAVSERLAQLQKFYLTPAQAYSLLENGS